MLWLLTQFKQEDVAVIENSSSFKTDKAYLEKELALLESGKAKTYSLEELESNWMKLSESMKVKFKSGF